MCVDLKTSFDHTGIVCLDFDNPVLLFVNFGEEKNKTSCLFFSFLNQIKKNDFFITTSPTNIGVSRFKVFFKLKPKSSLNYLEFNKKLKGYLQLPFNCENEATIFGYHAQVQSLGLSKNSFSNLIEINKSEFFEKIQCFEKEAIENQSDPCEQKELLLKN